MRMKRPWLNLSLARLAMGAWLAFLVTVVITAWLSLSGVLHPSFLYMAVPLVVMLVCTVGLVLGGIWRMVRGPGRYRALVWILVGAMPTLWIAASFEYMILTAGGRQLRPPWFARVSMAASSLVIEPYVRACYPYRHEGRRCVMWSDLPEANEILVAEMDAHIEQMETLLGEQSTEKAYWIRGPVWGIGGRYCLGWLSGSDETGSNDRLSHTDRHEAAHFALMQFLPPDQEVPALLNEGWAELHSRVDISRNAWRNTWLMKRLSLPTSLRELLSRDSYYHCDGPMYRQGYLLVDYLVRRFGHAKFLEFCRTCREATFEDDLRRVFGVSLDELEKSYQKGAPQYDSLDEWFLMEAELDDGVDREQWQRFAENYCAGAKRMQMAFCQSSVEMLRVTEQFEPDGEHLVTRQSYRNYRDGSRFARIEDNKPSGAGYGQLYTSNHRFRFYRKHPDDPWLLSQRRPQTARDYETAVVTNTLRLDYLQWILLPLPPDSSVVAVKSIGTSPADPQFVRLSGSIRCVCEENGTNFEGWWDLDPRYDYGIVASELHFDRSEFARTTVEYQTIDGHTVPRTTHVRFLRPDGTVSRSWTEEVQSCQFGPPVPEVLQLSTYGELRSEDRPEQHVLSTSTNRRTGPVTWTACGWTITTLLLGSVLLIGQSRRARAVRPLERATDDGTV